MKRKANHFDNSVDGKELKKIKKLTFKLDEDDNEHIVEETINTASRNVNLISANLSDNESDNSDNSDSESEMPLNDDCEAINDKDAAALDRFLNPDMAKDVIEGMTDAKKIVAECIGVDEHEDIDWSSIEGFDEHLATSIPLLTRYKKGREFPKTVKVLPQIEDWCYIMEKLNFPSWSSAAVQFITDQFKAKGGEGVEIFYKHFLLPYVRENIAKNRRLDNVLYKSLQAALFRRREFMTGILLPWCGNEINSLEAGILGNVLQNSTVKVDVAAPAMTILMTEFPFSKEILIVLNAMLQKKYNLSCCTINSFVDFFYQAAIEDYTRFYTESGKMPLIWFQSLNLFVSLYHPHINKVGAKKLFKLCKIHFHDKITEATRAYLKMIPKQEEMSD